MKLEAASRLVADALSADMLEALITYPADNTSQRGYLAAIANMLVGNREIGRDCRSVVARFIVRNPGTKANILLIGDHQPTHCLLTDGVTGKRVADTYNGELKGRTYEYATPTGERIFAKVLASVSVQDLMKNIMHSTFPQWVAKFPN